MTDYSSLETLCIQARNDPDLKNKGRSSYLDQLYDRICEIGFIPKFAYAGVGYVKRVREHESDYLSFWGGGTYGWTIPDSESAKLEKMLYKYTYATHKLNTIVTPQLVSGAVLLALGIVAGPEIFNKFEVLNETPKLKSLLGLIIGGATGWGLGSVIMPFLYYNKFALPRGLKLREKLKRAYADRLIYSDINFDYSVVGQIVERKRFIPTLSLIKRSS